jgi:hypothetical protein
VSFTFFCPVLWAAAIQCLKRKKLYEVQVEQLGNFQLRIHDQVDSSPNILAALSSFLIPML